MARNRIRAAREARRCSSRRRQRRAELWQGRAARAWRAARLELAERYGAVVAEADVTTNAAAVAWPEVTVTVAGTGGLVVNDTPAGAVKVSV